MRPIDLYMERSVRDTRSDQQASRNLLRESNSLSMSGMAGARSLQRHDQSQIKVQHAADNGMQQRDKMALASIAFCSPLMLLGMGATLAMMDNFKIKHDRDQDARNHLRSRNGAESPRELQIMPQSLQMSMDVTAFGAIPERRTSSLRKDKPASLAVRVPKFAPSEGKSWVKASKLVKDKQMLADHLEKTRGQLSLGVVSKIVSQIEKLDKALKSLGC